MRASRRRCPRALPRDASARADSVEPGWLLPFLEHRHAAALQRGDLTLVGDDHSVALRGEKAAVNACLADLDAILLTGITGYGLALEGASAAALVKAGREQTREQGK